MTAPGDTSYFQAQVVPAPTGSSSRPFVTLNMTPVATRNDWHHIACVNAFGAQTAKDIETGKAWDVNKGRYKANRPIICKVYDYYGALNKRNPKKCIWAGLGRVAGGPFLWGFDLIERMQETVRPQVEFCEKLPAHWYEWFGRNEACGMAVATPMIVYGYCEEAIHALMQMGRRIFEDLAWQHEAYLAGGLPEILRLAAAGQFEWRPDIKKPDVKTYVDAWTDIDRDEAGAGKGNLSLFLREQLFTIPFGYTKLGALLGVPTVMSFLADSPHPWGKNFYDFFGDQVAVPTFGKTLDGQDGSRAIGYLGARIFEEAKHDVTNDKCRWEWMRDNIYPTWLSAGEPKRQKMISLSLKNLCSHNWPLGL